MRPKPGRAGFPESALSVPELCENTAVLIPSPHGCIYYAQLVPGPWAWQVTGWQDSSCWPWLGGGSVWASLLSHFPASCYVSQISSWISCSSGTDSWRVEFPEEEGKQRAGPCASWGQDAWCVLAVPHSRCEPPSWPRGSACAAWPAGGGGTSLGPPCPPAPGVCSLPTRGPAAPGCATWPWRGDWSGRFCHTRELWEIWEFRQGRPEEAVLPCP